MRRKMSEVIIGVALCKAALLHQIGNTADPPCRFLRFCDCGKQYADKNCDYCNYNQKFHE